MLCCWPGFHMLPRGAPVGSHSMQRSCGHSLLPTESNVEGAFVEVFSSLVDPSPPTELPDRQLVRAHVHGGGRLLAHQRQLGGLMPQLALGVQMLRCAGYTSPAAAGHEHRQTAAAGRGLHPAMLYPGVCADWSGRGIPNHPAACMPSSVYPHFCCIFIACELLPKTMLHL